MTKHEKFLKRLEERNEYFKNGEFEVVGEYECSACKILCRNKYGFILVRPNDLLKNRGFTIKSAIDKTGYWINMVREVHGDKYDYSEVKYKDSREQVKIICPIHGTFSQKANHHLQGKGCLHCSHQLLNFKLEDWKKMCPGNSGIFYILRCWNENEEFYKVGITCMSVSQRYYGKKMPYSYEVVHKIKSNNREYIWELEKNYLLTFKNKKYQPKIKFGGQLTECFKL